jgi:spore coat protein U-like protein
MLLIRLFNRSGRKPNQHWLLFHFLFFISCYLYNCPAYATCAGLGCTCSVGTTAVAFGNYDPTSASTATTTGNVAVTCSALVIFTVSYTISMNKGNSSSFTPRFMNLTGNHLNYNLYIDAAHTSIWGDGTATTNIVSDSYTAIGLTETNNYTVYGLLPALQAMPAGTYTDSITVSVVF